MEDRLRKFARLVDSGSFTKAARELHISQPALTSAINKLERELHTALLLRGPRTFKLTPAGQSTYLVAKDLIVSMDNLMTDITTLSQTAVQASIGLIDSLAGALFASDTSVSALQELSNLAIVVNNSAYLRRAVEQDDLDVAFVAGRHQPSPKILEVNLVGIEPLVLVCHCDDAIALKRQLGARQLLNFISYDLSSNTYLLVREAFQRQSIQAHPKYSSTSPEIMLQLVLQKHGAAVLPYSLVRTQLRDGELSMLMDGQPIIVDRPISCVIRRGKQSPAYLSEIRQHLQCLLNEQQSAVAGVKIKL